MYVVFGSCSDCGYHGDAGDPDPRLVAGIEPSAYVVDYKP